MKVAITLGPKQTPEDAEEALYKALASQREGVAHDLGTFPDPAMEHTAQLMRSSYELIFTEMLREIREVIDEAEGV